jgi:hypothetical protein
MAKVKPIKGDPAVDTKAKQLLKDVILLNSKVLKNLDTKTLRDLGYNLSARGADCFRYALIRTEQSQGGQKGAKIAAEQECSEEE